MSQNVSTATGSNLIVAPRAVIAEDETPLREQLQEQLSQVWPELKIVEAVQDGIQALRALDAHKPEILFLDIQMPGATGIEVARQASGKCHIVFVTAYDQYAVNAFEQGAIDYVMKPYNAARLFNTVRRLKERMFNAPANMDGLIDSLANHSPETKDKSPYLRWINASQGQNIRLITVEEICYFKSDSKYTLVVTANQELVIRTPIKELIDQLDPAIFWQIHRSTVVNANAIEGVRRDMTGKLQVRIKQRAELLSVSDTFAHLFKQM